MAKLTFNKWLNQLLGAFVQGGALAFLSVFGLAGATALGAPVEPLNLKQCLGVFASGAVIKAMEYLKKQPVPQYETGDTVIISKPPENENE